MSWLAQTPWEPTPNTDWKPSEYGVEFVGVGDLTTRVDQLLTMLRFSKAVADPTQYEGHDIVVHALAQNGPLYSPWTHERVVEEGMWTYLFGKGTKAATTRFGVACSHIFADVPISSVAYWKL